MNYTLLEYIGFAFIFGGLLNYALMLGNMLPIPAIDGGQILIRGFRALFKTIFKVEIPRKVANVINNIGFVLLLGYQGIIVLCDIPFIQDFFMGLGG